MRMWPRPRSISSRLLSASCASSCGVSVPRTSSMLAKALMIRLTGEVTLRVWPWLCHWVRMDRLSLPTGIEMSSAGHSSRPTALTVS